MIQLISSTSRDYNLKIPNLMKIGQTVVVAVDTLFNVISNMVTVHCTMITYRIRGLP